MTSIKGSLRHTGHLAEESVERDGRVGEPNHTDDRRLRGDAGAAPSRASGEHGNRCR